MDIVLTELLTFTSGHKIKPKEHSNLEPSKIKTEKRSKDGGMRQTKEHGSRDSLNLSFHFPTYRPGSDMHSSTER